LKNTVCATSYAGKIFADVSGGYSPSILDAMRHAILMSKAVGMSDSDYVPLNYKDVFHLATLGGAAGRN
jgi:guanine deaminase